ncbi:MAG: SDR family NAD(P)-dependent oxidoreductase [Actinobacteria bacterium]|nr:SDR family NAD(P)-dependent oxidoreductase [Actinomycetota bacterium]
MQLEGKVALVTGASRGIGAATAVALAEAGARVACAARSTDADPKPTPGTIDETVRRIAALGGEGLAVPVNLADDDDTTRMVERTVERFGRLDVLVNNAAVTFPGDLDIDMKRYELVMAINTRAPLVATHQAATHMATAGGGTILNVSSVAGVRPITGLLAYGMSKAALERMTVQAADELAPMGIAVNCFRVDIPVASEGFVANAPELDHSTWEPSEVAAEGILWMLAQPPDYTGRVEAMSELREREGVMRSQVPGSKGAP